MYQCVIKYHHSTQGLEDYSTPGWSPSIARFFDGLAWPTTPEILWHNDAEAWSLATDVGFRDYPEEYRPPARIYRERASTALFWHSAHNAGWSPERVTEWMKRHPDGKNWHRETEHLARDPEMGPLFHDFPRKLVDGQICYPGGERINVTTQLRADGLGKRITEAEWGGPDSPLPLVGVPGVVQKKWPVRSVGISGWELQRVNATFVGGQRVTVSVSHQVASDYDDRLRWSVKLAGEQGGRETGMGGEWKELAVPGGNGTTRSTTLLCRARRQRTIMSLKDCL